MFKRIMICVWVYLSVGCTASEQPEQKHISTATRIPTITPVRAINEQSAERLFVRQLQLDVEGLNVKSIAEHIQYPLGVYINEIPTVIDNRQEFIQSYLNIFTETVVTAVICQDITALTIRSAGVMIGQGEIWIAKTVKGGKLKIIKINNKPWPNERGRKDANCFFPRMKRLNDQNLKKASIK